MGRQPPRAAPATVRPRYGRIAAALSSAGVTVTAVLGASGVLPGMPHDQAVAATAQAAASDTGTARLSGYSPARLETAQVGPVRVDAPPSGSGSGRRVFFDMSAQRVWLVDAPERVERTYLVSGSLSDLEPGTYEVYSTSRHAVGVDDSGTMEYMVRFAHGDEAAIGFHDIPVDNGWLVQTRDELGTPQSHGCIRQWRSDARALWDFAPLGTKVVVVA